MAVFAGAMAAVGLVLVMVGLAFAAGSYIATPSVALLCLAVATLLPMLLTIEYRRRRRPVLLLAACAAMVIGVGIIGSACLVIGMYARQVLDVSRTGGALIMIVLTLGGWGLMAWLFRLAVHDGVDAPRNGRAIVNDGVLFVDEQAALACSMAAVILMLATYQQSAWVVPVPLLIAAVVTVSLVASLLGLMVTTSVVAWWSVPVPISTQTLLDRMSERTGVRFARVLYFDGQFAKRPIMEVRAGWTGHRLLLSERALAALSPDEQLAVLAHEAAHVKYRHIAKELLAGGVVSWCVLMLMRPITVALFVHSASVALSFVAVLSLVNMACRNALRRRWERHADAYAARVMGGPVLAAALRKLLPDGPEPPWWTHDPRDVRIRRLEESGV